jgi:two-component system sensor histidine kinase UhpB
MSLRFRLNLMIALTILLIVGLGTLFAVHNARRSVLEEIDSTVNLTLQLIEASFAESGTSQDPLTNWLSQVGKLDKTRHLRIQVLQAPDGFAASERAAPQASPHSLTGLSDQSSPIPPRVPTWFAWAVTPRPIIAEKRVESADRSAVTILIEANPGDEIAEAWIEAQGFLMLIALLAVAVYALVHITVGRAFRSVGVILEGLEDIEKGEYGKRLPDFPLPEFSRISLAFNHTASALERARDENKALMRQNLAIQEEERRCLAQELHDELGQSLSAIKVMAASLRKPGSASQEAVDHIMAICDRLFGVVRSMMRRLRPIILDDLGLAASLEDLIENWRMRNRSTAWMFHCDDGVDECAGAAKIHVFRIVQECLTNIVKHAQASEVHIEVRLKAGEDRSRSGILLTVRDNGHGFDPDQPRRGFGLLGIRERVAGLGGRFALRSRPGDGVSLEVLIPCGENAI